MLTITGGYSYVKICINSLRRLLGMTPTTTVLICVCERCGYGRADHPKTARKPWVVIARPQRCKECGSPYWDASKRKVQCPVNLAPVVSAKSAIGRGARISVANQMGSEETERWAVNRRTVAALGNCNLIATDRQQ